jgi:crotonobetainyl-CoA:carnitine CoA-transferase CaiB-like acyl-CoA transferase
MNAQKMDTPLQAEFDPLPLAGVKVLDFGHTVMAPTCGLVLADLGATVVRIERVEGDPTRSLTGFGSGFFGYLNRNKESVAVDLKNPDARPIVGSAIQWADVVIENFGPEVMTRLGYGYEAASKLNERLVYCSLKGFLPGPYEARTALHDGPRRTADPRRRIDRRHDGRHVRRHRHHGCSARA